MEEVLDDALRLEPLAEHATGLGDGREVELGLGRGEVSAGAAAGTRWDPHDAERKRHMKIVTPPPARLLVAIVVSAVFAGLFIGLLMSGHPR